MPAPNAQQQITPVPLKMVGGNGFGRYGKISVEQTVNFIVSDNFLVPYAGYKAEIFQSPESLGRGIYSSTAGDLMVFVLGSQVYVVGNNTLTPISLGSLTSNSGDVFIAENNGGQIIITDKENIYIYQYSLGLSTQLISSAPGGGITFSLNGTQPISPGYVSFQNQRFIIACLGTQYWLLSDLNNGITNWPADISVAAAANRVGTIQSKPGTIQAAVPFPGGGNNLMVFGTNVGEMWQDLGLAKFPYQKQTSFDLDYGCLNANSIAGLDNFIVWLSINEQSGPAISYTDGRKIESISTDGIDFKLSQLTNPFNCTGFLFRQDGHLLYQFTFPDDNLSYVYDFETKLFFTVTDENLNYHPARQVVFFDKNYWFVSFNTGNVYNFGTQFTDADYGDGVIYQLPRVRITPPMRLPDQRYFIAKSASFTIENGQVNTGYETVSLSVSYDGGESFGTFWDLPMNPTGQRKSRFIWQQLGLANDCTLQFRFNGFNRFVATDGIFEVSE